MTSCAMRLRNKTQLFEWNGGWGDGGRKGGGKKTGSRRLNVRKIFSTFIILLSLLFADSFMDYHSRFLIRSFKNTHTHTYRYTKKRRTKKEEEINDKKLFFFSNKN